MNISEMDVKYLPGVSPKKAVLLAKELNIRTVEDLLHHYPYKYVDRSRFYFIHEISESMPFIQIKGTFLRFEKTGAGRSQRLSGWFTDGKSKIELLWFQGIHFFEGKYKPHVEYVVFGKPSYFNGRFNIVHPEVELISQTPDLEQMGLQPFYNTTDKMKSGFLHSKALQKMIQQTLPQWQKNITETLPAWLLRRFALIPLATALTQIHFPQNTLQLNKARQRLKFEELLYIQLSILRQTKWRELNIKGFRMNKIGRYFNTFFERNLPFELTNAQKRVLKEIHGDMKSGKQMNRLLQGDVGSGKTLVALMSMLIAIDNGYQSCLMAPTEILANQHFQTLSHLLQGTGVTVRMLTGSVRAKERSVIAQELISGDLHMLVGTHALIEDTVQFHNLGLVVIDEQHRFGVEQRARLWSKNTQPPHVLVMTATPIPRTLALTLYGDLQVSVIDELPPGRKSIQTYHYYESKRQALNGFINKHLKAGSQMYVVYPLIEESEKMDLQNATEGYEYFQDQFPQWKVSMVHGKMKSSDKEAHMAQFVKGNTQILVATTVIEVGVNVPNASIMVIENAERFGLAQLHQLRGRVGRGSEQSYCILLTGYKLGHDSLKKMEIMTRTNDGFEIAEADLQLRGPGDLEGTQQSGLPFELKIAHLSKDGKMLEIARTVAREILDDDPLFEKPENKILAIQLSKLKSNTINWGQIS